MAVISHLVQKMKGLKRSAQSQKLRQKSQTPVELSDSTLVSKEIKQGRKVQGRLTHTPWFRSFLRESPHAIQDFLETRKRLETSQGKWAVNG